MKFKLTIWLDDNRFNAELNHHSQHRHGIDY